MKRNLSSPDSGENFMYSGEESYGRFMPVRSISLIGAFTGAEYSCRSSYVLISARWLNLGTEAGVITGFGISACLFVLSSFVAIGTTDFPFRQMLQRNAFRWSTAYLAFAGFSLLWTGAISSTSSLYWLGLVTDVVTIALLVRGVGAECTARSVMKGFVGGSCAMAAIAWAMPIAPDLRLGDPEFFNTNQIGNLCAVALLLCFWLSSRGCRCPGWIALFLGVTLFRSLSKTTLIAFIVCQAYRLHRDETIRSRQKWLFLISAVAIFLVFLGLVESYLDLYTTTGNQAETLTGRIAIWAWALGAALNQPWFGNGFDAMWKIAPPFGGDLFEARHTENELLQQFFAYGLCGVVLLIGVYGSLYRQIRRVLNESEKRALMALLIFVIVRGLAEAEPFDLLMPLWLIALLAFVIQARVEEGARIQSLQLRAVENL